MRCSGRCYFDVFDTIEDFGFFDGLNKLAAWRDALSRCDSVRRAVHPDYPELLKQFLRDRRSELSKRMATVDAKSPH